MAGIAVGGWLRSPFNAGTNSLSLSPKHLACASSHQRMWEVAQNHFIPNRTHPRPNRGPNNPNRKTNGIHVSLDSL